MFSGNRTHCHPITAAIIVAPHFIVHAVINAALTSAFRYGDKTAAEEIRANARRGLTFLREKLQTHPAEARSISGAISGLEESLETLDERLHTGYENYCFLCEEVVAKLLREPIKIPPDVLRRISS